MGFYKRSKMAKNKNAGKPRNYALESGVYRFGKGSMYHKKAIYKFKTKKTKKTAVPVKPVFVEKKVCGAKNGGTRMVRSKKLANDVPTLDAAPAGTSKNFFSKHVRKVRASLTAGTVAILLAGVHKGKRVIVLKALDTGLLLITGPHKLNGCPMRRVNQRYLVATSTKVDVSKVKIPENVNDKYFARVKAEKEAYKPSEERKKDQVTVDTQVLAAIKATKDGAILRQYLKATFALSKGEFPHKMQF